jgi:hypothetical protein
MTARTALLINLLGLALATDCDAAPQAQWYTLSVQGQRVGYASIEQTESSTHTSHQQSSLIAVTQLRRRTTIQRQVEVVRDVAGVPLRMRVRSSADSNKSEWSADLTRDPRVLILHPAGSSARITIPLSAGAILPDQLFTALAPLWRRSATQINFDYLDPVSAQLTNLTAEVLPDESRSGDSATHIRISGRAVAGDEDYWFDAGGTLQRREQNFLGSRLTWSMCTIDCRRNIETPFNPMQLLVVRSPFHIPASASHGRIRYIIARDDGELPTLEHTAEQSLVFDGKRVIVTVCEQCDANSPDVTRDPSSYTQPNRWVQSEDASIIKFAKRADAPRESIDARMRRLTGAVRKHMTGRVDYLGYFTAIDALRDRSGDCSEVAVLLAAVARASGIPARIAGGLVYSDRFSGKKDVFSPHVWVQTWNGTGWVSYDAALDGFDATHIAISVGDGNPQMFADYLPQLQHWRIEKAGTIRPE